MANDSTVEKGISLEVLGQCMTNTTPKSQHDAKVEYRHLWSFAQQAALIAVSEKNEKDGCYHLIQDPERRAKRIAAHYADLYFESKKKSGGKVQFYWVALAAFVVKDIVEAYRFARTGVLHRDWNWDLASIARNNSLSDFGSEALTKDSPYQHVIRTYSALAKGNLWLFMDIYPWLWFFLEYGINKDSSLNRTRLEACLPHRDWQTFQTASKDAIEQLPFGPAWTSRLANRLKDDVIYKQGKAFFDIPPTWTGSSGYGPHSIAANTAHSFCRNNAKNYDAGYRTPPGIYWKNFQQAFYVMEAEHTELRSLVSDTNGIEAVMQCRQFKVTTSIQKAYSILITEYSANNKDSRFKQMRAELLSIAEQEQINVLQPLIYNDPSLKETMDMNHWFSRKTAGWISPKFKVIYRAVGTNDDPALETVFDPPKGVKDWFWMNPQSLPKQEDRMEFVAKIAGDFNRLMDQKRDYMDSQLLIIRGWLTA